jgi:hypothetical protein
MEKEEHTTEEALNATAKASFFSGPGGRQVGRLFAVLGIIGHDSHGSQNHVNPDQQTQAPIGRI